MITYMFDTNAFNDILDGKIDLASLPTDARYVVTHVQLDELNATKDERRKELLLNVFELVGADSLPTESMVWGVSRWGLSKWSSDDGVFEMIRGYLDSRNKGKANNLQDALIGETAYKNGFVFVTRDNDLYQVLHELGAAVVGLVDIIRAT